MELDDLNLDMEEALLKEVTLLQYLREMELRLCDTYFQRDVRRAVSYQKRIWQDKTIKYVCPLVRSVAGEGVPWCEQPPLAFHL